MTTPTLRPDPTERVGPAGVRGNGTFRARGITGDPVPIVTHGEHQAAIQLTTLIAR